MADDPIPPSWQPVLEGVLAGDRARQLGGFLSAEEAAGKTIYPPRGMRLKALELTPLDRVKVVILGQDPYHGPGQAMGLSFSVPPGVKVPPSLVNIYKEREADLGLPRPAHGDLSPWARQGVLLLNNALTVEAGLAGSHAKRGWEAITDACVSAVAARSDPSVFILWGGACAGEGRAYRTSSRPAALRHRKPAPKPAIGASGLFRIASLQPGQCLPRTHGTRRDRLVTLAPLPGRACKSAPCGEGFAGVWGGFR